MCEKIHILMCLCVLALMYEQKHVLMYLCYTPMLKVIKDTCINMSLYLNIFATLNICS
jgi:hypothetical protein